MRLGLEPARIAIVGDRVEDLERAFREGFEADLCLVSGGLGPTHDDRTVELVARASAGPLVLDEELERQIGDDLRAIAERLGRSYAEFTTGVRKQATLPEGAISLGLAGTAPGVVLDTGACVVVVSRAAARAAAALAARARDGAGATRPRARSAAASTASCASSARPESAVAEALAARAAKGTAWTSRSARASSRSTSTSSSSPRPRSAAPPSRPRCAERSRRYLFSEDERSISEIVLDLCRALGLTLATAESCTGGMVAARLTAVPGASDVFVGSVVAYANGVKEADSASRPSSSPSTAPSRRRSRPRWRRARASGSEPTSRSP